MIKAVLQMLMTRGSHRESDKNNTYSPDNGTGMATAVTQAAAEDLLPVDVAAMLSGKGCEGGAHLAPLCRTVAGQVVSIIIAQ